MKSARLIFLMMSMVYMLEAVGQEIKFGNPLTIPLRLSGTFGELRSDHFHTGIDIKTNQQEGYPVIAVEDGYVARIAVSPYGYGKAIYINHSNGYTSVYGHLQKMNGTIATYLHRKHYEKQKFQLDISLQPFEIKVKKGDTIAWSGNSGSSGGPHLHFEIREVSSQAAVNPLQFGISVKDWIRPTISLLKVYPDGFGSLVNGSPQPIKVNLSGWGPYYRLRNRDTLFIAGDAWFGIKTYDLLNDEPNHNGVRSVTLFIDSIPVFNIEFNRLYFDKGRYINALCDYSEIVLHNHWIIQTRKAPQSHLENIYQTLVNNGSYTFLPDSIYHLKYVVSDHYGNESILRFIVKGKQKIYAPLRPFSSSHTQFSGDREASYDTLDFSFWAPIGAFYDTVNFSYKRLTSGPAFFSDFHRIHTPTTPIHSSVKISIRPDRLPSRLQNKAIIVKVNQGNKPSAFISRWDGNSLTASTRSFGTYAVLADTLPPLIKNLNFKNGQNIKNLPRLNIKISDDLSGIDSYVGDINGKWILLEYDAKNNLLTYFPDEMLAQGENILHIRVTDNVGNFSEATYNLIY